MTQDELLKLIDEAAADGRTTLDLSGQGLSELPPEIGKLTNLKTLVLGKWNRKNSEIEGNNLTTLPDEIERLTELRSLFIECNELKELSGVVRSLRKLRSLSLWGNQLSTLPKGIANLKELRMLNFGHNQLSTLPKGIVNLKELRTLNLFSNQLDNLPKAIAEFKELRSLDFDNNLLSTLPEWIVGLKELRTLTFRRNQLSSLPERLTNLRKLRTLDLSGNQLSSLPERLTNLRKLRTLDLSGNQLSSLPERLTNLRKLRTLDLSGNQLSSLPERLTNLRKLRTLDLSGNQLSSLPECLANLTELRTLNLSRNQLSSLPKCLANLTELRTLSLRGNQLSAIPNVVLKLSSLKTLNLWGNKISHLPDWIKQLENVEKLDLRANQLPIPPEVLGSKISYESPAPASTVIDYYFQEKSDTPLYEAKLIIVGEGYAGKTTLAKKLIDSDYELNKEEETTEGIEVLPYEFDHPDGHRCKVNIWDFGGQEIYHATHQFFLSERAVYVLVTDSRQGNTDFYFWLNVIQIHGGNSPVLLIKNEKDERPCPVPDMQLRGQFKNLERSLETNLATNRNLETIRSTLEQYVVNLPHVGDPLPKTWAQVRSVLENRALGTENYITIQDYRQTCTNQGITDRDEQNRLSRFLHQLGVFLHFQDIDRLAKTIFLTPAWSTDAVYKVLDTPKVQKNYGRFNREDLKEIWKESQYADVRSELLALMQEFEVSYEIIGRKGHYIAPHLLEDNLPRELKYNWDTQNNLILSYHYPFKPKNIFPRFIVALHRYIENQTLVWKHGVVLCVGSARAEVIEDIRYESANINIRICGIDKKRLLSILGHELDRIHSSFSNGLKYETRIPCNCSECKQSQTPYQFIYRILQNSLEKRNFQMQCQQSFQMVNVRSLIDDVIDPASTYREPVIEALHGEPRRSKDSPFSNKLEIAVNFPPQTYQDVKDQSTTINQYGDRDNYAGDNISRDKIHKQTNNAIDIESLSRTIDELIEEISDDYKLEKPGVEKKIQRDAMERVEEDTDLRQRIKNALKAGCAEALEQTVQNPFAKVFIKTCQGFLSKD